jgi:predicted metal-dependent peptidase
MQVSKAMLRVLRARENVARRNVFFASILYSAKLIETQMELNGMRTMFTNGVNIYFHPEFVEKNDKNIEGVLLHETLHCALNHVGRRAERDHRLWNIACDFAINPLVKSVFPLPSPHLDEKRFHNLMSEEIYVRLQQEMEKQKQKGRGKDGGKGKPKDGDDDGDGESDGQSSGKGDRQERSGRMQVPTKEELEEAEREWRRVVKVAAEKAEKAGTMPGQLKRLLEEIFPSDKLDWRDMIDDMARDAKSKVSGSWARPNRRYLGTGTILPGDTTEDVFRLVVCLDTSGSITQEQTTAMRSEVISLLEQRIVTNVTIISTDTRVCSKNDVASAEEVKAFDLGNCGGGTDFRAAMKEVADVPDAVGCVFLTDMMTSSFGDPPPFPVVWVNWVKGSGAVAPYGRTVDY